jgi:hypothetical protein
MKDVVRIILRVISFLPLILSNTVTEKVTIPAKKLQYVSLAAPRVAFDMRQREKDAQLPFEGKSTLREGSSVSFPKTLGG